MRLESHPAPETVAASPPAPAKWLTGLGTLELILVTLWMLRTLLSGADFSALAGFVVLLPLWALVSLFAVYHLVRSPALRLRALVYLLAPVAAFLLISVSVPSSAPALETGPVLLGLVLLGAGWGIWRIFRWCTRDGAYRAASARVHVGIVLMQGGLSLLWLVVTLQEVDVLPDMRWAETDSSWLLLACILWIGSVLLCVLVPPYAILGLTRPFGRSLRHLFALELLMTIVLGATLIVPSLMALVAVSTALSG